MSKSKKTKKNKFKKLTNGTKDKLVENAHELTNQTIRAVEAFRNSAEAVTDNLRATANEMASNLMKLLKKNQGDLEK